MILSSLQGRNTQSTNRQICARGVFRSQTPRALENGHSTFRTSLGLSKFLP